MRANKRFLFTLGIVGLWSLVTYLVVIRNYDNQQSDKSKFHEKVSELEKEIQKETHNRKEIISRYANLIRILSEKPVDATTSPTPNFAPLEPDSDQNANELPFNNKINFNGKYIDGDVNKPVIPVIVFACNRVSVSRSLDLLIKYRPSREQFPIIVSQVCAIMNKFYVLFSLMCRFSI
jgi:alpha-1,3-mannosyl-glycoprotein beta-1,2-N-acetylglucosaminyltransferase